MVIGIVGLGLIGGSMAKAVSAHTGHKVLGDDKDEAVLAAAIADGAVIGELTDSRLPLCELIIVALAPGLTEAWFSEKGALVAKDTVVIDCCGTKRAVCAAGRAAAARYEFAFVGGHPMAGIEKTGYGASRADLFKGASMILVEPGDKAEMLTDFFTLVGFGGVVTATAEAHDAVIAYTSQLAHVVSSAYITSPTAERQAGFSAGSFKDMTRVAYLNEQLWAELFLQNRDFLAHELDLLQARLSDFREAIASGDEARLTELLTEGKQRKIRLDGGAA
ncbi:MAG TPA: prephenate dehydrogenase/arogenate dehydrogenase family protein [Terriglobales bacterium]|nr:prephenate dehydrogenase/arogenate dehydrogenase family protein [Terriglobales bacterium]